MVLENCVCLLIEWVKWNHVQKYLIFVWPTKRTALSFLFQKTNMELCVSRPCFPGGCKKNPSWCEYSCKGPILHWQDLKQNQGSWFKPSSKWKAGIIQSGTPLQDHRRWVMGIQGYVPLTPKSYPCKPIAPLTQMAKKHPKKNRVEITLQLSQGTHQCCSLHGHISCQLWEMLSSSRPNPGVKPSCLCSFLAKWWTLSFQVGTLPETNSKFALKNMVYQKERIIFQPSIFRGFCC